MSAAFFVSHGSPMIALEDNIFTKALRSFGDSIQKSRAVVVMSAHWRAREAEVASASAPSMIYDFSGFPSALSKVVYPAKGSPEIAQEVWTRLTAAGIACQQNPSRGFDHGVWTPLVHVIPNASIPIVPLAIPRAAEPMDLMRIGEALAPLRDQGIALMGSGAITHNLGDLSFQENAPVAAWAAAFDDWVRDHLMHRDAKALTRFLQDAPHARQAHPTWEHFAPVFFALGAARSSDRYQSIVEGFQYGTMSMRSFAFV